MYSDDTHVPLASKSIYELIRRSQKELDNISEWILAADPSRTEYMFVGHPKVETLKLNGSETKRVERTESLGALVGHGLNWESQFKAVKTKVRGALVR